MVCALPLDITSHILLTSEQIPDNIALGTDECLQRCGLSRTGQPTAQRQPRVSGNALPSGFSGPPAPPAGSTPAAAAAASTPAGASASSSTSQTAAPPAGKAAEKLFATNVASGGISVDDASGKVNPLVIALIVVCAVLVIGYVALAFAYFYRRRQERMSRTRGGRYFKTGAEFAPQVTVFEAEKSQPFESYDASPKGHTSPYDPPSQQS